ncbi:CNDD3 protein, partial [Tricholaema leucomelas]|nr:CNDD3 protein [Tricholaema leucomelas]
WVRTVWDLDFTEVDALDSRIEEEIAGDGLDVFTSLYQALVPFATEGVLAVCVFLQNIWTLFAEHSFCPKAFVAVLHHFAQAGQQRGASAQQRLRALHAAALYFLLLEVPGSIANQLFHQVMFDKCLYTLRKCWPRDLDVMRKRKKNHTQSSAGRSMKRGKPCRNGNVRCLEEILEEEEEEDCENVYFSTEDLLQLRNSTFLLLKGFLRLLPKFSLKEKPQSVQNCLQIFVEMTKFEPAVHEFKVSAAMHLNEAKYIPELAYYGLRLLCSPLHGAEDKILRHALRHILDVILMQEAGVGSRYVTLAITSAVTSARNQAIKFISSVVDELKEAVFPVLRTFLQYICTKVPDKAEYRTYAAQALVTLLNKLPSAEFADFISWLYKYSRHTKVAYRVFALDVVLALLEVPEKNVDSSLSPDQQKFLRHQFLVQVMVFGRCSDRAPAVRSKALSSFAHCLEMKGAPASESI